MGCDPGMPRVTLTLDDEADTTLERLSTEDGPFESKSAAAREIIPAYETLKEQADEHERELAKLRSQHADELQAQANQFENEIDDLETELERVHREKRQILEQREEHQDLVRAVEREQSRADRRARAGMVKRAKWFVFGMNDE